MAEPPAETRPGAPVTPAGTQAEPPATIVAEPGPAPATAARPARRARLDPETRRAQLVEVALSQLDDESRTTVVNVDEVADAAGVSRSLVYAYFGDRHGLAAEVYVRILDRLDREVGFDLPVDDDALRRVVGGCMAFAQRNRAAWRMVVSDPARQHPVVQAARDERALRISAGWSPPSPRSPTDGRVGQLAAEAALGMLEAGVLHWIDHPDIPVEQAAALLATIMWSGLTGRPSALG